jgi:hypothetical protein
MIKKFITYFIFFIFVLDANANSIFVNIKNNGHATINGSKK